MLLTQLNFTPVKDLINKGGALMTKRVGDLVTQPILHSHGSDDKVNRYEDSKAAFELYACTDKTFKSYEGFYRESEYSGPLELA